MENIRTKNALRNMAFGALNRIVSIFFPFIVRTIFIKSIGEEYLGLNTLYSSILQVLNLMDLGFANAIIASMYKPIADKDTERICALTKLYRNFGKETAMIAGLDYCKGDAVVLIDADLQDPPELIPEMLKYWEVSSLPLYKQTF